LIHISIDRIVGNLPFRTVPEGFRRTRRQAAGEPGVHAPPRRL